MRRCKELIKSSVVQGMFLLMAFFLPGTASPCQAQLEPTDFTVLKGAVNETPPNAEDIVHVWNSQRNDRDRLQLAGVWVSSWADNATAFDAFIECIAGEDKVKDAAARFVKTRDRTLVEKKVAGAASELGDRLNALPVADRQSLQEFACLARACLDKKKLDGVWELAAHEANGLTVLESSLKNDLTTLTVDGESFTTTWHQGRSNAKKPRFVEEQQSGGTLKLDPAANPREVDFTYTWGKLKGTTRKGIYQWSDGKLMVCIGGNFGNDRPKEFKTATVAIRGNGTSIEIFSKGSGVPKSDAPKRSFGFEFTKPNDAIDVREEKKWTVFIVASKSYGIGGATISLKDGQWPARAIIRFQGFSNLESFRLETERITLSGSIKSSGHMPFAFVGPRGNVPMVEPGAAAPAGELDVRVQVRDGSVEVTLPANLFVGSQKATFEWTQAFLR